MAALNETRRLIESLGPPIAYRKLHGILNALEMQVEDGRYQAEAVRHLGEALLETAKLYQLTPDAAQKLETAVRAMISRLSAGG